MTDAVPVIEELKAIDQMVARVRVELAAGHTIDLAPLDERVAVLCGQIESLPASESQSLRSSLITLVDELGQLALVIEKNLAELAHGLGQTSEHQRALSAYGKNPGENK